MLLFSYGSNHPAQLAERLGHEIKGAGAMAVGWQRVFRGWSTRWNGGVATMIKKKGATTYGYVAKVSQADLRTLDRFEGVASGNYHRMGITVETADGREPAVVYLSTSSEFNAPSGAYLSAVAKTVGTFWDVSGPEAFPIR